MSPWSPFSRSQHLISLVLAMLLLGLWWFFHYPWDFPSQIKPRPLSFVEVQGRVRYPGVYWFEGDPSPQQALAAAGGVPIRGRLDLSSLPRTLHTGSLLRVTSSPQGTITLKASTMDAARRVVLQIPLDLNRASLKELEALPYIGPRQARYIIRLRQEKRGFRRLGELLAVPGIGPRTLDKLKPFVAVPP